MRVFTRQEAKEISRQAVGLLDYEARPLESGMLGCPWRIMVAHQLTCRFASVDRARTACAEILDRYPTPDRLVKANYIDLIQHAQTLNSSGRRVRVIQRFTRVWVGNSWDTILDLPELGLTVFHLIQEYVSPLDSTDRIARALDRLDRLV